MGVTAIDPRTSIVAALQARLAGVQRRAPARASAARGAQTHAAEAGALPLAQRIAAIDRSDPDRRRKAVRVVLEAELARSFGLNVLNDPVFPQMVDAVQDQMQADPQTGAAVHALGDLLLAGAAAA